MISTVSLSNELLYMPTTLRCQVLCFTILYLFTTESPTRLSFFLNKPWNCLWIVYHNFERYLFLAESSLTLNLWNKAIFLSYLIFLESAVFYALPNFTTFLLTKLEVVINKYGPNRNHDAIPIMPLYACTANSILYCYKEISWTKEVAIFPKHA